MNLMVISFLINALNTLSRFQVSKILADTECAQCHRSFTVAKGTVGVFVGNAA